MNSGRLMNLGEGIRAEVIDTSLATPIEHAKAIGKQRTLDDCFEPFFVADLSAVASQLRLWRSRLPRVEPFYSVKCNDDAAVLRTLDQLGAGFACATKSDIRRVLQLGVPSERIICTNPCKLTSMIRLARDSSVALMTFDSVEELYKVKENYPEAKLVLRILPHGTKSRGQLGKKFGASYESVARLIHTAKSLNLDLVGVSFHIGSDCQDAQCYVSTLQLARRVVDDLITADYTPYLVDIGGGFSGELSFSETAEVVAQALDETFPGTSGFQLIAEPGRFMVERAFVLMTNVIAKRTSNAESSCCSCCGIAHGDRVDRQAEVLKRADEPSSASTSIPIQTNEMATCYSYYLNDGVYGSFSSILLDVNPPLPHVAKRVSSSEPQFVSTLYGPTCDGLDCVAQNTLLPELFVGDWIYFENMGAYTLASSAEFSGMPHIDRYYLINKPDATIFRRELVAMVVECGSLTSDFVSLVGESFLEELRCTAASACHASTGINVADHALEIESHHSASSRLHYEIKSVLRQFRWQRDVSSDLETDNSAIAELETLLNALAAGESETQSPAELRIELSGDEENEMCERAETAPRSARDTEAVRCESDSTVQNSQTDALTDEPPAFTLIFD